MTANGSDREEDNMRNSDRHKRLKRLEQQEKPKTQTPIFIDGLENGQQEIHTLKRGRKQLLSKAELEQCPDDRPVFIDDI